MILPDILDKKKNNIVNLFTKKNNKEIQQNSSKIIKWIMKLELGRER